MTKKKKGRNAPHPDQTVPEPDEAPAVATPKKPARTRAEIVNDLFDDCKKSQLIEIAREACMRDGDWASLILTAFEDAMQELAEAAEAESAS